MQISHPGIPLHFSPSFSWISVLRFRSLRMPALHFPPKRMVWLFFFPGDEIESPSWHFAIVLFWRNLAAFQVHFFTERNLQHSQKGLVKPWFNFLYVLMILLTVYILWGWCHIKNAQVKTAQKREALRRRISWYRWKHSLAESGRFMQTTESWPCTFAMLGAFLCFWPACRDQMTGWMLSHPRTDLWATMVSGSVFRFRVIGELPLDVQMHTHIVNSNQLPMHRLPLLPWPHPCLLLFQQKQTQIFTLVWILFYLGQFYLPLIVSCVIFPKLSFYPKVLFS